MRPYPLTPQVMNGTGALRQFVPRVARHSSRATFGYWPARQSLNDALCRNIQGLRGDRVAVKV